MTKKLVLLACILALAIGASAQSSTTMFKGPWKNAPKSHAVGSSIGSIAIRIARSIGCTVITTVGSADKAEKARALLRETGVAAVAGTAFFRPGSPTGENLLQMLEKRLCVAPGRDRTVPGFSG